ncbi:MAG: tetratricopeptide repeat protein [Waddliaceae bacterium]|jgi:predicted Zn-dependent protease|nr:tetratricopeptide repeat protein [Waddliaceae bacterium]MBT3579581.1 tetratricopeptide repeat protein [Waddliaceae bacterium]MBT4444443.1 tetratricopeptide repeat protein [Waddliaceae bacterium]MBT6928188.1 tetratricopeptide repeat protein [Waddliaceae bacterium]MBT7264333.1 tetratricopeptide repeat protein [Waddliaceae bacterium]
MNEKHRDWCEVLGWDEEQLDDLKITGYSYIRQGKYEIAKPFFEALTALEPHEPYNFQTLGAIYLQIGDPQKALEVFDKALSLDEQHAVTHLNKAKALLEIGSKDEGFKIIDSLVVHDDAKIATTAQALAMAYR